MNKTPPAADTVVARLRLLISEFLCVNEHEVTLDSRFTDDLGADSLDCIEIVMMVEEEFKIAIDDDEAEELDTIHKLATAITAKKSRGVVAR